MTGQASAVGVAGIERVWFEAVIFHPVPCGERPEIEGGSHAEYTNGCPHCLTGVEAHRLNHPALRVEDHGVVSDSAVAA